MSDPKVEAAKRFVEHVSESADMMRPVDDVTDCEAGWIGGCGTCLELYDALKAALREPTPPGEARLSAMLYRSLERISLSIEGCAKIGFQESKPTTNERHAQVWNDLNDAQADAKLKLKHYAQFVSGAPTPPVDPPSEISKIIPLLQRAASMLAMLADRDATGRKTIDNFADELHEKCIELRALESRGSQAAAADSSPVKFADGTKDFIRSH